MKLIEGIRLLIFAIGFAAIIFSQGCATMMAAENHDLEKQRDIPTYRTDKIGFNPDEAKQLLEFCIELNNQDDRVSSKGAPGSEKFNAQLGSWKIIYDSRAGKGDDPHTNGFGPFNNAWLLLNNKSEPNEYALAIRGTVSQSHSILDDILATTIAANAGIEFPENTVLPVTFAATPRAEIHLGFAYAAFSILFDKKEGILAQLHKAVPSNAKLFITGHSQGASIATLVHAFLHYAITDGEDRYELKDKKFTLKSYVFAQPKPGNAQFAQDFARIAGSHGIAFVINNNLDPVPQVPISRQTIAESIVDTLDENKSHTRGISGVMVDGLAAVSSGVLKVRDFFAERISDKVPKLFDEQGKTSIDTHYFASISKLADTSGNSFNYSLAGVLIPVFGLPGGGDLYGLGKTSSADWLLQHHAISYRKLMEQQL